MRISKWSSYKPEVTALRKSGRSLPSIADEYGIAKSTLSYWFKDIELSQEKKALINECAEAKLKRARLKSAAWHRNQKQLRILKAEDEAISVHEQLPESSDAVLELSLAMLYFGEGSKNGSTGMGASDPFMLLFFIASTEKLYGLDRNDFRYDLHLRDDQNSAQLKEYWAKKMGISTEKIKYISKDPRTKGKPTRPGYMGVCQIVIGKIAIQRRLKALYNVYCSGIISGT